MKQFVIIFIFITFHLSVLTAQQQRDSTMMEDKIDQVVITAQFTPTDTRETVNSVRVITRKTIEQRSVVNLQELLQTEPNIRITQDAILGSDVSINGLKGENLKILIDGVPIVGRLNGNIDAGQIPLSSIERIEIIEGAQSLLYGSEASGGVINLITKKSQLTQFDTELNSQYETNGFRNLTARVGYSKNNWIVQATGSLQNFIPAIDSSKGRDQIWNPKRQQSGRAFVRYTPSENTDFRLSANILNEKVDNLGDLKRPNFKPYSFDDYYLTDRHDVSFHMNRWTKSRNLFQATLGYNSFNRIKNSYRMDFDEDKQTLLEGSQDTSSATGYLTRFTYAIDNKSRKWNYLFGLENNYETANGTRLIDTTSSEVGKAYTNDLGLFASTKVKISDKLTFQTGARWTANMRYGSALTPSTWLLWQPKLPFQARFSYAYGFRSPSIKELFFNFIDVNHYVVGNSNLNPEKSLNLRGEITWKTLKFNKVDVTFTGTGFYNNVDDRIILTALGPVHYEYRNVDSWKTKGASFKVNTTVGSWLRFQSDVITTGFNNSNIENDGTSDLLWSTDWTNDLTLTFMDGKVSWNIWQKLTGKTPFFYNQDGKTERGTTNSYNMLNTGLSTHFWNKKIRINTGLKNIFNIRELDINNNNGIHIEASNQQNLHWGRTFYVNLILHWQN